MSTLKVILLGPPGVGKTSYLISYIHHHYIGDDDHYNFDVTDSYRRRATVDDEVFLFDMLDIGMFDG